MTVKFYKYQGTGNDFVMIDNREGIFKNDTKVIQRLCDRKFGIGADGLILLENSEDPEDDFKMVYFNSDGNQSTMCGNGGRCLVRFAEFLNIVEKTAIFTAIDGKHHAKIEADKIHLQMQDVDEVKELGTEYFLDTGSPHHIVFTPEIQQLDVKKEGAAIRYNEVYKAEGTNVNFVEPQDEILQVRTYERGVEDETLSCGTGVTAVAIASTYAKKYNSLPVKIQTPGGNLEISFKQNGNQFTDVWLSGPAEQVFEGVIEC